MNQIKTLLGTMRVPFLLLTPACLSVGVATAYWQTGALNGLHVLLILLGALSAHISVNVFNECFDYQSGLDIQTSRTPFSGGSGALPDNPQMARAAWRLAWITFCIAGAVGIYFLLLQGWGLLPIGILGLLLLVTYTTWWVYHPIFCLLAPGLGFGVLMVMGTHFALTGSYSLSAFVASLLPTCLVSGLLLLNQFPDVEADKSIGRKHLPITIGLQASSSLYALLVLLAYLSVIVGVAFKLLPLYCLIALLSLFVAWPTCQGARRYANHLEALIPVLGKNVVLTLITPLLLSIGLFLG